MDNFRLCRICISQSESPIMLSIFGEDALWKKITSFANVHIEEGDGLPQEICLLCAKSAVDACMFKQKCEETDSFYRKQLLKRMELRLPDDTEIISVSSGSIDMNNGGVGRKTKIESVKKGNVQKEGGEDQNIIPEGKFYNRPTNQSQNNFDDNFPILIEGGLTNGEWDGGNGGGGPLEDGDDEDGQDSSMEDQYDDSLPLIPEIELITPNDDDSHNQRDVGVYQCNACFKCFSMKSVLKHHIKNYHPESNPMYECFECKKTYLSKRFLEKHIRLGRCVKKRRNTT